MGGEFRTALQNPRRNHRIKTTHFVLVIFVICFYQGLFAKEAKLTPEEVVASTETVREVADDKISCTQSLPVSSTYRLARAEESKKTFNGKTSFHPG